MKYYFFRDLNHEDNLMDGKTHHAAGYVNEVYCNEPSKSGKDLAVTFLSPFEGIVIHAWRSLNEVELFEVDEWEYTQLVKYYESIDNYKE